MGCSCKQTPLQKAENRLVANGWARMSGSDMGVFDNFIRQTLGADTEITNQTRPDLYAQSKHTINHQK